MSAPYMVLENPLDEYALLCRSCLAESGEMKNIFEWDLAEDFYNCTNVQLQRSDGTSELLCTACEEILTTCKRFRIQCQNSDQLIRGAVKKNLHKAVSNQQAVQENVISNVLSEKQLIIMITAPNMDSKIYLSCPHCPEKYIKQKDLMIHLVKVHHINNRNFSIELQYYCSYQNCSYYITSGKNKYFQGRKFLNQHYAKVHMNKFIQCRQCNKTFATEPQLNNHLKSCNVIFLCQICNKTYSNNEGLLVHLLRKHPDIHRQYKDENKMLKRKSCTVTEAKKPKIDDKFTEYMCDSPKRSFATQTAQNLTKNDVALPSWNIKTENFETKTDEISTQTVFKDLLSLKSQTSEDESLLTEVKKPKIEDKFTDYMCDSPKRSFATQTAENNIKNDVALPSWNMKNDNFETKTDEISTQTVFEDLLSLKSQTSEDESIFFSETVSLSDIQTQTFPLEFGLSKSNKETLTDTQSLDLSMKETQTCFCLYDSPKINYRLFDSVTSSPCSLNLATAETQTQDIRSSVKSDVLLSFNSAETQTSFEENIETASADSEFVWEIKFSLRKVDQFHGQIHTL